MPTNPAPGSKAPAFSLPRDGGGKVSLADFKGQNLVLYFYPRADTPGCTVESEGILQPVQGLRQGRNRGSGGLGRSREGPGRLQGQARARHPARLRRDPPDARRVRGVGRKIHVRQEVHGDNPDHLPDRPGRADRANPAQGEGRGSRRGGSGRRQGTCEVAHVPAKRLRFADKGIAKVVCPPGCCRRDVLISLAMWMCTSAALAER